MDNPKLILHFDINKTLILGDKIQSQSLESSLLGLICEQPLGIIDENKNEWIRKEENLFNDNLNEDLYSYSEFLRKILPKKNENEIPDKEKRLKYNAEIKQKRRQFTDKFIDKNSPGEFFHNNIIQILENLKIPEELKNDINNGKYPECFKEIYSNGYFFIFKSFFKSIIKLKEKNRNFSIIFRSFGGDVLDLINEFNEFCKGNHPIYHTKNNKEKVYFDGTHNSKNYLLNKSQYGIIYRYSKELKDIFLVIGATEIIKPKPNNIYEAYKNDIKDNNVTIIEGGKNIYNFLLENFSKENFHSFAIRDDYSIWNEHVELKEYSKPFLIDPYNKKIHQIFFDDNITYKKKSIVDCRNIITGQSISDHLIKDKYIVKSNIGVLVDDYYFFNKICNAEKKREKDFENKNNNLDEKKNRLNKILNDSLNAYSEAIIDNENISFADFISNFIYVNKLYIDEGK